MNDRAALRKRIWTVLKWLLTAVVLVFVAKRAVTLWQQGSAGDVELHLGWLTLAGVFYAIGWLPSAWYFKALLSRMGDEVPWRPVVRAYYCGHLGKYAPGKAFVPIIRGQMIAAAGGRFRSGALAVVYDTLVMMGVGLEISVALLAFLLPEELSNAPAWLRETVDQPWARWLVEHPWSLPVLVAIVVLASLPVVGHLFSFVAAKIAPIENQESLARRIDSRLIGTGFVLFTIAWVIHGLSLWATLRGVGADVSIRDLPTWTASVALPMAAGFIVLFAPGGVGVREGVMIEVLQFQPGIEPRHAVAAAFALRAVGFATEVVMAIVLYYGLRPAPKAENSATAQPPSTPASQ